MNKLRRVWKYFHALFWGNTSHLDPTELEILLQQSRAELEEHQKEKLLRQNAVKVVAARNHLRKQGAEANKRVAGWEAEAQYLQKTGHFQVACEVRQKRDDLFNVAAG